MVGSGGTRHLTSDRQVRTLCERARDDGFGWRARLEKSAKAVRVGYEGVTGGGTGG
jgi:hypothetical protein